MDYFSSSSYSMPLWGWSVIGVGVAVIALPVVIFLFYKLFKKLTKTHEPHDRQRPRRRTVCHLCRRTVSEENWSSGRHRRICAVQHRGLLSTLRTPDAKLRCRHCSRRLRIWPDGGHEPGSSTFICSGHECPRRGVPVRSGTGNRFACFRCNFNLCDVCAEVILNSESGSASASGPFVDRPPSYCLLINNETKPKAETETEIHAEPETVSREEHSRNSLPTYEEAIEWEEKMPLEPQV